MKPRVFLLVFPAYLALFWTTSHAHAINITSSISPSTRFAPTGSLNHAHGHVHMHARLRVHHRQAIKYASALSDDTSGAALPVKDFEGLRKRELSRLTFFTPGLGACGGRNTDEEFIVALSAQDWDDGSHCNDKITIIYNGRSVHAEIVDECMGCPAGGLDLSAGLFSFLADPGVGVIYGQWVYGAGEPTAHAHTSVASKAQGTSTYTHHSSHTHTVSTDSASLSNATHSSSSTVSQRALPTSGAALSLPTPTSFLEDINILILQYSSLLEAATEVTDKRSRPSSV